MSSNLSSRSCRARSRGEHGHHGSARQGMAGLGTGRLARSRHWGDGACVGVGARSVWCDQVLPAAAAGVGVPGSESRVVTGREVLMLGELALLMTVAAVVVVERRRPY